MKKVSEWLNELNSHAIYDAEACAQDYEKETGNKACRPTHTVASTIQAIKARGLGGTIKGKSQDRVCYGYEIAEALAETLANSRAFAILNGRGSRFRAAIEAIKEAGL